MEAQKKNFFYEARMNVDKVFRLIIFPPHFHLNNFNRPSILYAALL